MFKMGIGNSQREAKCYGFNINFIDLLFGSGGGGSPGFGKCPAQHGLPILVVTAGALIPLGFTIDDAVDLVDFVSLLTDSVSH